MVLLIMAHEGADLAYRCHVDEGMGIWIGLMGDFRALEGKHARLDILGFIMHRLDLWI
jgi:hypothetical protein